MRGLRASVAVGAAFTLAACHAPPPATMVVGGRASAGGPSSGAPDPTLRGRVDLGYATAATTGEIGTGGTVSLIDPTTGVTYASTVTRNDGTFVLSFQATNPFVLATNTPYLLEEVKGLMAGGQPNRPGARAARLRTFVSWNGTAWTSLTGTGVVIDRSTTTLAVVAKLRSQLPAPLLATLTAGGTPDATSSAFPPALSTDYATGFNLVAAALTADDDPVADLYVDPNTNLLAATTGASVGLKGVTPAIAHYGSLVTFTGYGLSGTSAVTFNGVPAASFAVVNANTVTAQVAAGTPGSWPATASLTVGGLTVSATMSIPYDGHRVVDMAGNLYFLASVPGIVYKWAYQASPSVAPTTIVTAGVLNRPSALALDAQDRLFVSDTGNQRVAEFNSTTGTLINGSVLTGVASPSGLAFDSQGYLYVANATDSSQVLRVYPGTAGTGTVFATLPTGAIPWGVCFDGRGNLFVSNNANNTGAGVVLRYPPQGGGYSTTTVVTMGNGFTGPTGLACAASDSLWVGVQQSGTTVYKGSAVYRIDLTQPFPAGYPQTPGPAMYGVTQVTNPHGIALDPNGQLLIPSYGFAADGSQDSLVTFNPANFGGNPPYPGPANLIPNANTYPGLSF